MLKVQSAVSGLVQETALATVDKVVAFLGEKIEIDTDMRELFDEFTKTLKTDLASEAKVVAKKVGKGSDKPKRTRAPSSYNMYIKGKMAEFKEAGHTGNLMKMAIDAWNKDKEDGKIDDVQSTEKKSGKSAK